ncbi:MAG TPA: enoyl-CoA hydratase/isomerase family protein, partial [Bdellovibrionales bacterium]|nr:enoyl-CoA hydratase/isomerase family protein [Bdellovibrionales bacterium]
MATTNLIAFDEIACAEGQIGLVTLQNTASLNALTLEMFQALHEKLRAWAPRPEIRVVVIQSESEKAFSAGGDVKALALETISSSATDLPEKFFWWEYATDYLVHQFPKPVLCWLDGITMGGGVGISSGASHRVVTERTKWAMPELNIGFFPDVGAGYFLNQLPEAMALFLAWTGAPLSGPDAVSLKLADHCLPSSMKNGVLNVITETAWSASHEENHWKLSELLQVSEHESATAQLPKYQERILKIVSGPTPEQTFARLLTWNDRDEWIRARVAYAAAASPLSVHLTYHHLRAT